MTASATRRENADRTIPFVTVAMNVTVGRAGAGVVFAVSPRPSRTAARFRAWLFAASLAAAPVTAADDFQSLVTTMQGHISAGRMKEAVPVAERLLAMIDEASGPDDPQATRAANNLAALYSVTFRPADAERLYRRVLAARERASGPNAPETAETLERLAEAILEQDRPTDAEAHARRALAIRERTGREDLPLAGARTMVARCAGAAGRFVEAERLLRAAIAIRERDSGAEDRDTVDALAHLAGVLDKQGTYAEAARLHARVVQRSEAVFGPKHPQTAVRMGDLAATLCRQGRLDEAEPLLARAHDILAATFGETHSLSIAVAQNQAALLHLRYRHEEAEKVYDRIIASLEAAGPKARADLAIAVSNRGELHRDLARYLRAEQDCRRALALRESLYGPDHPSTALSLDNLASIHDAEGRSAEAERELQRVLTIRERFAGMEHPDTATTLAKLGQMHRAAGRPGQAAKACERALTIFEKTLGADHDKTLAVVNTLALLADDRGEMEQADRLFRRVLSARERVAADSPDTAVALGNVAACLGDRARFDEAEAMQRKAIDLLARSLGESHPETIVAISNLAVLQLTKGDLSTAAATLDRARRGTRGFVADILPGLLPAEQVRFLDVNDRVPLDAALWLGWSQREAGRFAELSASWLANAKGVAQEASALRAGLANGGGGMAGDAAELARVREELAGVSQLGNRTVDVDDTRARIVKLRQRERELVHALGGQVALLSRPDPWVKIDAVRRGVVAGSCLVDIVRFQPLQLETSRVEIKRRPARYAAWIVPPAGKGNVRILDLGPADEIDAAVAAYRGAIEAAQKSGFPRGQATAEEELAITAEPLSTKVLQPIIAALGDATEVILSPDGSLWLVPWQAIPLADGSYAIEQFAIRTVTSARDLVPVPMETKGGKGGSVVVADPAFDAAPAAPGKPAADTDRSLAPSAGLAKKFLRLANTRAEALATKPAIAALTGSEPKLLLGPDASETNLKQSAVRPRTVVLATHGFFLKDQEAKRDATGPAAGSRGSAPVLTTSGEALEDPLLRCGLALAGANVGAKVSGGDDGILTGAEIVGLDLLDTALVVLSACETGVGKVQNGEGVAGLRQAFQIAGAKSVVATLWQVPDRESAQLMSAFYANLAKGEPASQALREAQLAFIRAAREDRAGGEAAHPYRWAAYGVTGR